MVIRIKMVRVIEAGRRRRSAAHPAHVSRLIRKRGATGRLAIRTIGVRVWSFGVVARWITAWIRRIWTVHGTVHRTRVSRATVLQENRVREVWTGVL
jgi:hypothetical protein